MRRPSSRQRRFVILLLAVLTFGIAYYGGNKYTEGEPPQISGVIIRPPMPVPGFELLDRQGEPFTQEQLEGHWSLLLLEPNPLPAPPAILNLVQIHNRLAATPDLQRQIRFIHLPRQDAAAGRGKAYGLGTGWFILSGEHEALARTFDKFGVDKIDGSHTLFLIDPDASIHALFTNGLDAATIANDIVSLITHQRR